MHPVTTAYVWTLWQVLKNIVSTTISTITFGFFHVYFPTCQVRVVRFYVSCPAPSPSPSPSPSPRQTSSASSWSQWASPDLHCQLSIAVSPLSFSFVLPACCVLPCLFSALLFFPCFLPPSLPRLCVCVKPHSTKKLMARFVTQNLFWTIT